MNKLQFISAGAGSGKTFSLTDKLQNLLINQGVQPKGVMATTFTKLAAAELQERVRQKLIETGQTATANAMGQATIGTVNGVCGELLKRFSFEAGLSPEQKVLDERDAEQLFAQAMEAALENDVSTIQKMNTLSKRLGLEDSRSKKLVWQKEIENIVSAARANNMQAEQFTKFSEKSAESLLSYFPQVTTRDLSAELLDHVNAALSAFDSEVDKTKTSRDYFQFLKGAREGLINHRLTWPEWIKLSKQAPGAKSRGLVEGIQLVAGDFGKHAQLHSDIRSFIGLAFSISGKCMETFQSMKKRLGMVDFVDQENQLYQLLDHTVVQEALAEELELLMVDEFQDTSPIQLALFIKLAELADRVIWVGDVKQSIYGFRGSDPELMLSVIQYLDDKGVVPEVLPHSWRSRPELVEYINQLFVPAFDNTLQEQHVKLLPTREDRLDGPAVMHWTLQGKNKPIQVSCMASAIRKMVEDDEQNVFDKDTKAFRPTCYGDIAILCRSNANLETVAHALAALGIPANYKRAELLSTPEAVLALACLRRLADSRDTLATAEIRALFCKESPEDWLTDRIRFLQTEQPGSKWGEESLAALSELALQRQRLALLTPAEAFELALQVTDIRQSIVAWCSTPFEAQQRLNNVDALLAFSKEYLEHCNTQNLAATVPGLILWLNELAKKDEDWQADAHGDAITLVTHHRSKGLEWPIVIAMDLASDTRMRLWGLTVEPRAEGFQWAEPLADRSLRYWPGFFGNNSKGVAIKDAVESGVEGQEAHRRATEEDKRLLYVSLTRARDCLIFPMAAKKVTGEWMQSLGADWMLPQGNELELPDGTIIPSAALEIQEGDSSEGHSASDIYWPDSPEPISSPKYPRFFTPSKAEPLEDACIKQIIQIGERAQLLGTPEMGLLGSALHAIIATEVIGRDKSISRVQRILNDFGVTDAIKAEDAMALAHNFIIQVETQFHPQKWHVEYPIHYSNDYGQVVKGWIDLALETESGWVIIDHKSSPLARNKWESTAVKYSGQLKLYKEALGMAGEQPVRGAWIHFAVTGGLLEVA